MATSTFSVKKLPFHPILLALDLDKVTFFHFASIFFCEFGISVFKPLKKTCIPYPFKELFKEIERFRTSTFIHDQSICRLCEILYFNKKRL